MPRAFQRTISVAGLNVMETDLYWARLDFGETDRFEIKREPDNPKDKNAIEFWIDNISSGYVPKHVAAELAPLMDEGWQVEGNLVSFDWHEDSNEKEYAVAKVKLYGIPPNPTDIQKENFQNIRQEREDRYQRYKSSHESFEKEKQINQSEQTIGISQTEFREDPKTVGLIGCAAVLVLFILIFLACSGPFIH